MGQLRFMVKGVWEYRARDKGYQLRAKEKGQIWKFELGFREVGSNYRELLGG